MDVCVIVHSKSDFADMIMLRILRWSSYPGGLNVVTGSLQGKEGGRRVRDTQGIVTVEVVIEVTYTRAKCGQPLEAGKAKKQILP